MEKFLINEKVEVEDAGARRSFARGERREDFADAWRDTGNVVLVGLPGSGKSMLAARLAERTGAPVAAPTDAVAAAEALAGRGTIIVLAAPLVEDAAVRPLIHGAGKVFYLMADSRTLADRLAERDSATDGEDLWRELSDRLETLEPLFYEVLHFIVRAVDDPEAILADVLEKIAY